MWDGARVFLGNYMTFIGNSWCFLVFLRFSFIFGYLLIIGLDWLIKTLELLLILFSANQYCFRLIVWPYRLTYGPNFQIPLFIPIPTPASALVVPMLWRSWNRFERNYSGPFLVS